MRSSPKHYAEALCEVLDAVEEDQVPEVLDKFVEVVAENGDIKKMEDILVDFGKEWDKREGLVEAKLTTAHKTSEDLIRALEDHIKLKTGASRVELEHEVDEAILGGAVVEYKDKVLDLSLKKDIKELREAMRS